MSELVKASEFTLAVVCPTCKAAVEAKCTINKTDGSQFVEEVHLSRVTKYLASKNWPKLT